MPRIEIELTSSRPDGAWTWRAAGARQPKGALDGSLLYEGASVGDVVRADVEVDVDGMTVTSVVPPKTKKASENRLEIIGPPVRAREDVTYDRTQGFDEGRERSRGRDRAGGRPPRAGAPSGGDRPRRDSRAGGPGGPGGPGGSGGPGGPGRDRGAGPGGPGGPGRTHAGGGAAGDRSARPRPPREREPRAPRATPATPPAPPPRPKRLHAGRAHRAAVLASLAPEEQPIAEQVLRGGIPAVRQALEEQNAAARASGAPEVKTDALVALAEELLPRLRAAEWRDRAEAAIAQKDDVALRDLRSLVAGADAARREEAGRDLAIRLREALDERSAKERDTWVAEISEALDAGRVLRALRASSRPPEPGVRFPAEMAARLSEAAGEALGPDVTPDRWAAALDAIGASPVRRVVKPRGLPPGAPDALVAQARLAVERIPGLAPVLGMPPPVAPVIGARRPAPPGPPPRRPARVMTAPAAPRTPEAASSTPDAPTTDELPAPSLATEPEQPPEPAVSGDDGNDAVLVEEIR